MLLPILWGVVLLGALAACALGLAIWLRSIDMHL
jgi:hypothetical protein